MRRWHFLSAREKAGFDDSSHSHPRTEEKACYVALSPAKEEKEAQAGARGEDFRLPDGNVIRVSGANSSFTDVRA